MILPDHEIRKLLKQGRIFIEPLENPDIQIQPSGVDMLLGNSFRIFRTSSIPFIDTKKATENCTDTIKVEDGNPFIIHPGEFVLGIVREYVRMPPDLVGSVDGRSSLGRLGVMIHTTSSSINPGWEGRIVLEITNLGKTPVALYPGQRVAKLTFHKMTSPSERPYNARPDAKYQKQSGIVQSRIHQDDNI
jgi:dCTP deaminase